MLDATDKRLFLGIGILEAASQLLGFIGASKLPGKQASKQAPAPMPPQHEPGTYLARMQAHVLAPVCSPGYSMGHPLTIARVPAFSRTRVITAMMG